MSHFSTVRTQLRDRDSLVQGVRDALTPLSHPHNVDAFLAQAIAVYDQPVALESAYNDSANAHVVIHSQQIGFHSDIGFKLNPATGVYELVADDYGYRRSRLAQHYSTLEQFQQQVQVRHDRSFAIAQLTTQGFVVEHETVQADGTVQLVLVGG